jgi:dolichol-phosphate mannosyltransferase
MSTLEREGSRTRSRRRVCVVLPAFNEEARIGTLLDRIDAALQEAGLAYQVLVVDDGSRDRTAEIVREKSRSMPVTLRQHEVNKGLGVTIRDGLLEAVQWLDPDDVIVTMDADDTHTPGLVLRMVRMISEGHDVVIASRYQPGSRTIGVPLSRRACSLLGSLLFRLVLPIPGVRDFTCGYRAYRAGALKAAIDLHGEHFVDQEGFQCMVDILLKLRPMQLIFGEVPFILRYDFKEGQTKMKVARTITATLKLLAVRRLGG